MTREAIPLFRIASAGHPRPGCQPSKILANRSKVEQRQRASNNYFVPRQMGLTLLGNCSLLKPLRRYPQLHY